MWQREEFYQYKPGMELTDFPDNLIPIMQMEHLRQMDCVITRGISYERTAYTFLAQVELSNKLHFFKNIPNACVLLNEEGAMIRHDNEWDLIFTPDKLEGNSLEEDSDLYPVFKSIIEDVNEGRKCWIRLNHVSVKSLLKNIPSFNILDNYCRNFPGGYLSVAQKIVTEGTDELFSKVPVCRYGGLTCVDLDERENFNSVKDLLEDYIIDVDNAKGKALRPLSIAVFGAPGSGKSFGVKQISKSLGRFNVFTLNLSQYTSYDEMLNALDQSLKSSKDIPLIFFDEFDSEYQGVSRGWLKFLLAPMADGEYTINGQIISIEKAVFVFAGATASSFSQFVPTTSEETAVFKAVKGPDFISRLRGILNIKGPNPSSITDKSFIIRRALLLRDLIKRKVPQLCDENDRINISVGLLTALLRTKEYKHGTRSMEFILDMSRLSNAKKFTPSCLPMQNQMDLHLDFMDLNRKLSVERIGEDTYERFAVKLHALTREIEMDYYRNNSENAEEIIANDPEVKVWDELSESYKDECRTRLRYVVEMLEDISFPIGVRPIANGMNDAIEELKGEYLDKMARLAHNAWITCKLENGWKYSEEEDRSIKISPDIRSYDDLTVNQKEARKVRMSKVTAYLKELGLELYKKSY